MDFVILGFLMIQSLSQYDLLKAFSQEVSPFYSASLGSIQTRLKKLEKLKYVSCSKDTTTKRVRNVYAITPLGKKSFHNWMLSDVVESKFEAQLASRIFFLGHVPDSDKMLIVGAFITFLEDQLVKLNQATIDSSKKEIPAQYKEIAKYQLKTLDIGLFTFNNTLKWCKELLAQIQSNEGK